MPWTGSATRRTEQMACKIPVLFEALGNANHHMAMRLENSGVDPFAPLLDSEYASSAFPCHWRFSEMEKWNSHWHGKLQQPTAPKVYLWWPKSISCCSLWNFRPRPGPTCHAGAGRSSLGAAVGAPSCRPSAADSKRSPRGLWTFEQKWPANKNLWKHDRILIWLELNQLDFEMILMYFDFIVLNSFKWRWRSGPSKPEIKPGWRQLKAGPPAKHSKPWQPWYEFHVWLHRGSLLSVPEGLQVSLGDKSKMQAGQIWFLAVSSKKEVGNGRCFLLWPAEEHWQWNLSWNWCPPKVRPLDFPDRNRYPSRTTLWTLLYFNSKSQSIPEISK